MSYPIQRTERPRLYRTPDDPEFRFPMPADAERQRIRSNILQSCEEELERAPAREVPQLPHSPYPHHNLYLCFYNAMLGQSIVEQFAFGYLLTRDARYAAQARRWVRAILGWDHTINTFYSSARIMHALAVAEDWLGEELSADDRDALHAYNAALCRQHAETIDELRGDTSAGGHSTLYPSHFGVAALSLLGIVPEAETWLGWVIEKFERALLPFGVAEDGTYPPDGNWAWGYSQYSKFLFMDALKNVTGIDLYAKYHADVVRALEFIRHAYVGGSRVEAKRIYGPDETLLTGFWQLDNFSPAILKLAAVARDPFAQWIGTRDPNLGRIQYSGNAVKGGAEFTVGWGPFGYLWYDPLLETLARPELPPSRLFPASDYAVLRSGWEEPAMVVGYQGCRTLASHDPASVVVHWSGRPLIRRVPSPNAVPRQEGNAPAMAGEMELRGFVERFTQSAAGDYLRVTGCLTEQEVALLRGDPPCVVLRAAARRRTPEEARLVDAESERYLRLGPAGYLQYAREGNFCADAGALRLRFRLRETPDATRTQILFGVGQSLLSGGGSSFHLGFCDGRLTFVLRDHQSRSFQAQLPPDAPPLEVGRWHTVTAWWHGLNGEAGAAIAGLALAGHEVIARPELPPGEPFVTKPNTALWVGAAVQSPETDARVDLQRLEIFGLPTSPDSAATVPTANLSPTAPDAALRPLLFDVDFARGLDAVTAAGAAEECAEGPLELRLHPYARAELTEDGAELAHGEARLRVISLPPDSVEFALDPVPYAQAGFASGSFVEREERFQRLIVRPTAGSTEVMLVLLPLERYSEALVADLPAKLEQLRAQV